MVQIKSRRVITVFIFAGVIFLTFLFAGFLAKTYLVRYINNNFALDFSLDDLRFGPRGVTLRGVSASGGDFSLCADSVRISLRPNIIRKKANLVLSPLIIKTENIVSLPVSVAVEVIQGEYKFKELYRLYVRSRIILDVGFGDRGMLQLNNICLENIDFDSADFKLKGVNLKRTIRNHYDFSIAGLIIKNKEIKDILLPLRLAGSSVILPKTKSYLFGPGAFLGGAIHIKNMDSLCFDLACDNISLETVSELLSRSKDDFELRGLFSGNFYFCVHKRIISGLRGDFVSQGQGRININQEASLDFLKRYFDERSWKVLIEGFKDYKYNMGKIHIYQNINRLGIDLNFNSEAFGGRNLSINFHDVLGGKNE